MDNEFYTLLTNKGMAKIAAALAEKKQLHLQKMAVGDGGGQYYEPNVNQTKLSREVWRGEMNTLTVAPNNPNWLIAEVVLPENIGGWYVREVGVFDTDGDLIAIGKFPESYKPLLPGGSGKQVCIRLIMEVSNTTAVTLTVDPSVVLATRDYVDSLLDEHEHSTRHPDATLKQKGFTQLSNATNSDDETKAATPKAVKAALAEARNHTHTWSQISGVPDGTLTQKGVVKLNSATNSTSTTEAATPSAVKAAMDKANAAAPASHTHPWNQVTGVPDGTLTQKGVVKLNNATNSTSTTEAATPSAVKAAMDKANEAFNKAGINTAHTHIWGDITGVPESTLTQKGIVKLRNATNSTSTTEAATPNSVKVVYDLANGKVPLTRKINGKTLNQDITISAADLIPASWDSIGAYNFFWHKDASIGSTYAGSSLTTLNKTTKPAGTWRCMSGIITSETSPASGGDSPTYSTYRGYLFVRIK